MPSLLDHYAAFFEFSGLDLIVVSAALWSLISVRRSLRKDREADRLRQQGDGPFPHD